MILSASKHKKSNWGDRDVSDQLVTEDEGFDRDKLENEGKLQEGFLLL